jgi:hypothetical protein
MAVNAAEEVRPCAAPVACAGGTMLLFWGTQTHWLISAAGATVLTLAIWTWINEVRLQWLREK